MQTYHQVSNMNLPPGLIGVPYKSWLAAYAALWIRSVAMLRILCTFIVHSPCPYGGGAGTC